MKRLKDLTFSERQSIGRSQLRRIIRNRPEGRSAETQKYLIGTRVLGYSGKRSNVVRSVDRQIASETSSTSRSIRSKAQADAVNRAFQRRKRTTPGVYYDLILKKGEDIAVWQYAVAQLYDEGKSVMIPFKERGSTIWATILPRILIQGGKRAAIAFGFPLVDLYKLETGEVVELGRDWKLVPSSMSQRDLAASTFGDFGDDLLRVRTPPKDLAKSIDEAVEAGIERLQSDKSGFVCTRMVFDPNLAWDLYGSINAEKGGIWIRQRSPDTRIRGDATRTVSWTRVTAP